MTELDRLRQAETLRRQATASRYAAIRAGLDQIVVHASEPDPSPSVPLTSSYPESERPGSDGPPAPRHSVIGQRVADAIAARYDAVDRKQRATARRRIGSV